MRFHLFRYRCDNGHAFSDLGSPGESGVLLLRSTGRGTAAVVDTYADAVFNEVSHLSQSVLSGAPDYKRGRAAQAAFSITCDPDVDGSPFGIGVLPHCPTCRSGRLVWWEGTEPPEIVDTEVAGVAHTRWSALPADQREERLTKALLESLAGPSQLRSPS